jgi:uncharacterized membrane protein YoaK (UPF0700 family)
MIGQNNISEEQIRPYDHITIGLCLSLLGGFLDSYSYLLKGNVFANAQTGNVVLLFVSLANSEFHKCLKYLIPIITFALGVLTAEIFKKDTSFNNQTKINTVLLIEAVLIFCIAFWGKYFSNYAVNCLISFIAAIQVTSFDRVNKNPVSTTMITGNLKSGMIHLSKYLRTKETAYLSSFYQYSILIIGFGFGVILGSVFIKLYSEYAILVCELFVFIPYVMLRKRKKLTTASSRFGALE